MIEIATTVAFGVITGIVAVMRLVGVTSIAYQAIAHVVVGILLGVGLSGRALPREREAFLLGAVILTVIELAAFIASKLT